MGWIVVKWAVLVLLPSTVIKVLACKRYIVTIHWRLGLDVQEDLVAWAYSYTCVMCMWNKPENRIHVIDKDVHVHDSVWI